MSPLTQHIVEGAASAAGFTGWARFLEVTGSTNTDLLRLAREGAPSLSVLVAGHQEAGRGRRGRAWVEPPGSSLLVSVLLRPPLSPSESPLLTLVAGVALVTAVRRAGRTEARCKWPNDVVARGRKLGGILGETEVEGGRLRHVVIGAGVNVSQAAGDFTSGLRVPPTSIAIEGGQADPAALLEEYLRELGTWDPERDGFGTRVVRAYRALCDTIGRRVSATDMEGRRIEGLAVDVGESGELLVEGDPGTRTKIRFGEVDHLR